MTHSDPYTSASLNPAMYPSMHRISDTTWPSAYGAVAQSSDERSVLDLADERRLHRAEVRDEQFRG